ncbi:MAG: sulfurtransferase [Sulfuricurvum sp. PC08-66]|nr:MAG: sulfurtransferase [Sulfuricurvum sp. PC08-66]
MTKLLKVFSLAALLATNLLAYEKDSVDVKAYPKGDILISAEEAIKLIGKQGVVFVSGDSPDSFKNQHIQGSVVMEAHHIHHSDKMGQMHCAPLYQCIEEAEHFIGSKGIDNDTLVIAYDDYRGPNATGVYSFFKSYGHDNIKVLMGGFKAINELDPAKAEFDAIKEQIKKLGEPIKYVEKIKRYEAYIEKAKAENNKEEEAKNQERLTKEVAAAAKKYKNLDEAVKASEAEIAALEKKLTEVESRLLVIKGDEVAIAKQYHIDPKKINMSAIASKEDVLHAVKDIAQKGKKSEFIIIDSRGMIEIIGENKLDNVARGGHIPGATFLEWKQISDDERGVAFKKAQELAKTFEQYGITKDKTIYAYCHVGAGRGSELVTALEIMGYKNAKVYTGSWDEWGNDMSLPIKR